MSGAVVLTGATGGIGRATALALLRDPDRHVVVTSRHTGQADDLARELAAESGSRLVHGIGCDLASLASVRAAAGAISRLCDEAAAPTVSVILGNAGVHPANASSTTVDGFELAFGTNVLGHYLLTRLLAPSMASPGRVVFVTSSLHFGDLRHNVGSSAPRWADIETLARPREGRRAATARAGQTAYSTSKLALVHLAHEFSRRVPDGVDVYSFNPRLVPGTGIIREQRRPLRALAHGLAPLVSLFPGTASVTRAGEALVQSAIGPRPAAETGAYLDLGRPVGSAARSYDTVREEALWDGAERLVESVLPGVFRGPRAGRLSV